MAQSPEVETSCRSDEPSADVRMPSSTGVERLGEILTTASEN